MNQPLFFNLILPIIIMLALSFNSAFQMVKALYTGTISYGYKYYGNEQRCDRKKNPFGFWLGITFYSGGVFFCLHLGVVIISHYFG